MHRLQFFREWLHAPASVGACVPSSSFLAHAMCAKALQADFVVELGAGTGAMTRVLAGRFPASRLLIVEPNPVMAVQLKARYPHLTVVAGCTHELSALFAELPARTHFVSSIPFRSLPAQAHRLTVAALHEALTASKARALTQFTYLPGEPFVPAAELRWWKRDTILLNFPPAFVWELQPSK